uniref:WW domain-containing protein n=1 Tax=Rhizochromulina marina TaxID=1034831 RepID=A0A7S2SV86_9STRA|mmetsp:Transcript_832/g.2687  ORF Transcript_832/g.2687 Transcript_832/m.2687 type:complete len:463 (+) Transcript_832:69-1457(+)
MASQGDGKSKWRSAADPRTGRTYYYHSVTKETTWNKPLELTSPEERQAREEAESKKKEFFRDMELNMRKNLARGLLSSDIAARSGGGSGEAEPGAGAAADAQGAAGRGRLLEPLDLSSIRPEILLAADQQRPPSFDRMVRTISTIDDLILEEAKRSEPFSPLVREGSMEGLFDSPRADSPHTDLLPMNRRNSTSTLYVGSTMSRPDKDATIKCVCTVIRAHMLEAVEDADDTTPHPKAAVFLDHEAPEDMPVPSLQELVTFFREIYVKSQMEIECIIMSLIYLERVTKVTKGSIQVRPNNWKSLLVSTMIMASKVWDDLSMWNADFSQVCPSFTLRRINELELALLDVLGYIVKVAASDYAKYYFHIRSYCVRLGLTHDLDSLAPLDLTGAKKLQNLSADYEAAAQATALTKLKRRSSSMPDVLPSAGSHPRRSNAHIHEEQACIEQLVHMRLTEAGEQPKS